MTEPNKELLDLPSKQSILETLLLDVKDPLLRTQESKVQASRVSNGGFLTTQVLKSQVLGKVKEFLGVMAEANEKLKLDTQNKSSADFDVEVLSGNEKEYIEMVYRGVNGSDSAQPIS